jgi:hypothetical protein
MSRANDSDPIQYPDSSQMSIYLRKVANKPVQPFKTNKDSGIESISTIHNVSELKSNSKYLSHRTEIVLA